MAAGSVTSPASPLLAAQEAVQHCSADPACQGFTLAPGGVPAAGTNISVANYKTSPTRVFLGTLIDMHNAILSPTAATYIKLSQLAKPGELNPALFSPTPRMPPSLPQDGGDGGGGGAGLSAGAIAGMCTKRLGCAHVRSGAPWPALSACAVGVAVPGGPCSSG